MSKWQKSRYESNRINTYRSNIRKFGHITQVFSTKSQYLYYCFLLLQESSKSFSPHFYFHLKNVHPEYNKYSSIYRRGEGKKAKRSQPPIYKDIYKISKSHVDFWQLDGWHHPMMQHGWCHHLCQHTSNIPKKKVEEERERVMKKLLHKGFHSFISG